MEDPNNREDMIILRRMGWALAALGAGSVLILLLAGVASSALG